MCPTAQVFGVTTDPLIVYTSNLFAILSLRALYGFVATIMSELRYLDKSVAIVLGFVGTWKLSFAMCPVVSAGRATQSYANDWLLSFQNGCTVQELNGVTDGEVHIHTMHIFLLLTSEHCPVYRV